MSVLIFFQLLLIPYNIVTAKLQGEWQEVHEADGKKFKHWPWDIAYGLILCWGVYLSSWWLMLLGLTWRLVVFNPMLNITRKNDFFYVNKVDKKGSLEWFFYGKLGISYKVVWAFSLIISISLNIILYAR